MMILPTVQITPCKLTFVGKCDEYYLETLIGSWIKSEQVLSDAYYIHLTSPNVRTVYVNLSSPTALDEKWNGFYAKKWLSWIKESGVEMQVELLNEPLNKENREIEFFILGFTRSYFALRSGADFEGVPLFYLGFKEESEFQNHIRSLMNTIESLDYLETNIIKFRRSVVKELYDVNSITNQKGIKFAKEIERRTGIPTYYFLNRYTYNTTLLKELNRDLGTPSNTYLCLQNENFQLINPSDRIVSNITNQLLHKAVEYAKKHPQEFKNWDGQHE